MVAGDKHKARLLATTTYDGTGATIVKATATRAVCDNTLDISLSAKGGEIRTRHSTKVDHAAVGQQLATIVQGMGQFKRMGDAMAQYHLKQMVAELYAMSDGELLKAVEAKTDSNQADRWIESVMAKPLWN